MPEETKFYPSLATHIVNYIDWVAKDFKTSDDQDYETGETKFYPSLATHIVMYLSWVAKDFKTADQQNYETGETKFYPSLATHIVKYFSRVEVKEDSHDLQIERLEFYPSFATHCVRYFRWGEGEDYPDFSVPECYVWSEDNVAQWIASLGFPQYKECFRKNFISGRKLILLRASHFPKMNITNFEHIKMIAGEIRGLLHTKLIEYSRSVSLPPREPWALFLEKRCFSGDSELTYPLFLRNNDMKHNDP